VLSLGPVNFGVKHRRGGEVLDKEFGGNHHNVFVIVFSFVVYEGSGEEVCSGVCFSWGMFYFIPIVFQDRVPPGQSSVELSWGLPECQVGVVCDDFDWFVSPA